MVGQAVAGSTPFWPGLESFRPTYIEPNKKYESKHSKLMRFRRIDFRYFIG